VDRFAGLAAPPPGSAPCLREAGRARKQRREDDRLWNVALTDARVMADLSRAMSRDAARDVRGYY
jgi:hypothetical protein